METFTGSTNFSDRSKKGKVLHNFKENARTEEECKKLNEQNEMYHPETSFHYDVEVAKELNVALVECKDLEEAYERVLGESVQRYNTGKKPSRQTSVEKVVEGYINKGGDEVQSLIVQVGNQENAPRPEVLEQIYKEYLREYKERFPNMVVVQAHIHKDEDWRLNAKNGATGTMHLQMHILPIKKKELSKEPKKWRGPDVQLGLTGALEQMGYSNEGKVKVQEKDEEGNLLYDENGEPIMVEKHDYKNGALAQFQKDFNGLLDEICAKYDIEIDHYQRGKKVTHQIGRAHV